ncbi:glycosyltransferase family 2 protein [Vampirovibrio chlorellavorus]|uniref:glycosyltransferase family 2 protein n=1 Tax=Vampirovibrio chlorellavorus TaxID=758823 RepID=UPI0026EEC864|nr:glycosyltransferase family 2 protein [Vampirovibrio chlorellavorus]
MKEKILLLSMIAVIWLVVFLTGKVMPRLSSVVLLLVFMILYTWLMTLAMVHHKRMEAKRPKPLNLDYLPRVSVVISAHNEQVVIENTIYNLLKLDYPDYELLIMDDRSTDQTPAILTRLGETLPLPFRYHLRPADAIPGKPAVLNEALTLTDGEVICVFDADAYVESDFLRRIVPFLADENVGAVQARKIIANGNENWLTRCQNYEYSLDSHFQYGRDSVRGAVELRGNGQLVKREALEEVNGWNVNTLTDDLDLSTRLHIEGWDIRFAHKVPVFEEGIVEFGGLLKQRRRWTEGTLFRYLEYAGPLLRSRKASLRTTLDMVAYFLEFLLPLWLVLDLIQLGWGVVMADPTSTRIISSLLVIPIFCLGIASAIIVAIIRFNRPPLWEALKWTAVTSVYLTILWIPLVFGIMVKVLWQKQRRTRWDKTEHKGSTYQHALDTPAFPG